MLIIPFNKFCQKLQMFWAKQALVDRKIEHNFFIIAIENNYNLFQLLRDLFSINS